MRDWWALVKCCGRGMVRQTSLIYYAWFIWKNKNATTFERELSSAESIACKVVTYAEEGVAAYAISFSCDAWRC